MFSTRGPNCRIATWLASLVQLHWMLALVIAVLISTSTTLAEEQKGVLDIKYSQEFVYAVRGLSGFLNSTFQLHGTINVSEAGSLGPLRGQGWAGAGLLTIRGPAVLDSGWLKDVSVSSW